MSAVGVGMIGYGFMGKTHSLGYRDVPLISDGRTPRPRLLSIHGRNREKLEDARQRFGWEKAVADWRDIIADPEIQLVDCAGPNDLHVEPAIAAAKAGKHVFVEKPLAPTADDALRMWQSVEAAGIHHMCAFNYRFFPAMQLAREIVQSGELGTAYHYRSNFLLSTSLDSMRRKSWRDDRAAAGSGALGDLGSHHIDLSRFLLSSDPVRASCVTRVVVPSATDGAVIETDDLFAAILEYENGAVGVLEASRVAGGHLVTSRIEIDGSKGSLRFSLQNLNELQVAGSDKAFRAIPVLRAGDPYQPNWFPPGHPLGWVDSFSHEALHMFESIGGLHTVEPIGATFKDGYYCCEIVETLLQAAQERRSVEVSYRSLG